MRITGIPLRTPKNKKQWIALNLNSYRNNHYQVNNKAKRYIADVIRELCCGKEAPKPPLQLTYRIYRPTRRKADLANIGAVLDKFVSDGLVHAGLIEDDNTDFIKRVIFEDGGVDKHNPRADLEVITCKRDG